MGGVRHPGQEVQQEPRSDIQPGAGKDGAACADREAQFVIDLSDREGQRGRDRLGAPGQQEP